MDKNANIDIFTRIAKLDGERAAISGAVYHYTKKEVIPLIFKEDTLSFKLTKASEFDDKLEGKCAEVFWDLALEELTDEGIIDNGDRRELELIKAANAGFLYRRENAGEKLFKSGPSTTYIGCFSMLANDDYMINKYIKNDKHDGIRIKLNANYLLDWKDKIGHFGYDLSLVPVLYGREVVDYLKHYLTALIESFGGVESELFMKNAKTLLKGKLLQVNYMAKTGKYRHENECRIVLRVPISKPSGYEGYEFEKVGNGITFKIPKYALMGYEFKNMDEQSIKETEKILEKNGYRLYSKL